MKTFSFSLVNAIILSHLLKFDFVLFSVVIGDKPNFCIYNCIWSTKAFSTYRYVGLYFCICI